jgi:hypothetical protein
VAWSPANNALSGKIVAQHKGLCLGAQINIDKTGVVSNQIAVQASKGGLTANLSVFVGR